MRLLAQLVESVIAIDLKGLAVLLMMNVAMMVLGAVLEGLAIVLITLPLSERL